MAKKKRRTYTPEFRAEAVALVEQEEEGLALGCQKNTSRVRYIGIRYGRE